MRQIAKSLIIRSGGLSLYHRAKHREVLTVLMFHRVLPENLISTYGADEEYTISTASFERLIGFVTQHYNVVGLDDVLQSQAKQKPLPSYPLMVTFDDGWEDNASYAAPVLGKAKVPWTLFAATDAISSGPQWWQETLLSILRTDPSKFGKLIASAPNVARQELPSDRALALLLLYGALPPKQRDQLIAKYSERPPGQRDMADWDALVRLRSSGVALGGHGASHLPLPMLDDPLEDLRRSRQALSEHLGNDACSTMSFPHGRYTLDIARLASNLGTKLMFTSDPVLNKCPGGWLQSDLVGRIAISARAIGGSGGHLDPERLMPWLMLRTIN